jgi:hypothetical protein
MPSQTARFKDALLQNPDVSESEITLGLLTKWSFFFFLPMSETPFPHVQLVGGFLSLFMAESKALGTHGSLGGSLENVWC